jgi:muramidase (phage lysozyme)
MNVTTRIRTLPALCMALAIGGCTGGADSSAPTDESATAQAEEPLSTPTCNPALANGAVPLKHHALLNTIGFTEGTAGRGQDGYNVTFGYHYFSSCNQHPHIRVCSGGYCSDAAGRYQFLSTTWHGLGLPNFHPDNQERGAMKLVARRGAVIPTNRALTATEFVNVMNRISWEWASLPPGRYGQPSYSMATTRHKYCTFAGC